MAQGCGVAARRGAVFSARGGHGAESRGTFFRTSWDVIEDSVEDKRVCIGPRVETA